MPISKMTPVPSVPSKNLTWPHTPQEMAKTWRHLAASYELERFVINLHRTKNALPIAPF
jgi:hypothetical protein